MNHQVFAISPDAPRHPIHTRERNWAETNCYCDVWIELLHGWGFDPVAALPFTAAIDFEGDQWTFFKYRLADLDWLYGLDVQELQLWRPLHRHLEEQVSRDRPVLVELDSFYLPDTEGTAYRHAHVKTTVAVIAIDLETQTLGYFHGQGYYHLHGDDFRGALRITDTTIPEQLPPYVEIVKRRTGFLLTDRDLLQRSLNLLHREVERLPAVNPFETFQPRFASDLRWLADAPLETFHQYSFATLRQFGACYELMTTYLDWLAERGVTQFEDARTAFAELSSGAKSLQFQLARAMARKKPMNLAPLDTLAGTWQRAVEELRRGCLWLDSSVTYDPEFLELR